MAPKQRKFVVIGFRAVGKSSITVQYVENHFVDAYNPTIENTFTKTIKFRGEDYLAEIVDTAGLDEHSLFPSRYSAGVHGFILVYSVASKASLEMIRALNDKILTACGTDRVPRVLVGNKSDLVLERQVSAEDGKAQADQWGCGFVECSAKHNENVVQVFTTMLEEIEKQSAPRDAGKENGWCGLM